MTKYDTKPTMPVSEAAKSAQKLESWPAAGVCATTKAVEDELSAENTVSITDDGRWGHYFTIEQVAAECLVRSFGISRAWRKR